MIDSSAFARSLALTFFLISQAATFADKLGCILLKPKLLNLAILSCFCNGCEIYFTLLLICFYLPIFYFASLAALGGHNCFINYLSNEITFPQIALYCFNSCSSVEARLIIGCRTYLAFYFAYFCNFSLNLLWSFIL